MKNDSIAKQDVEDYHCVYKEKHIILVCVYI